MDYKIEELPNFHLHVIKTKKFKNIHVSINFRRLIDKNERTLAAVLQGVLINSSKKYKKGKDIEIATEDLYGSYISINSTKSGKCNILSANTTFLHNKYTEKGQFQNAVDLLYELILRPNVTNKKFDKKTFDLARNNVRESIESRKDYPGSYSVSRLLEEINKDNPVSFKSNLADLKKINVSNLYEYYLDIINNDIIDIFVIGDVNNEMIEYVKKKFNFKPRDYKKLDHFVIEKNICKKLITKEALPVNQSIICLGYVFDDLTPFEARYVMSILNYILGGSSDSLLFKNVREKESLCYSISSSYSLLTGGLLISTGIDKANFKKTKDLILKQVKDLQAGNFRLSEIKKGKTCYENSCISMLDKIGGIENLYRSILYINSDNIDDKIKKINKVTKKDVVTLANKMHLSKIFFLEGDI